MIVSSKMWTILNFSLTIIALFLFLNLLGIQLPTFGRAVYAFDQHEPLCVIQWKEDFTEWKNLDRCCLEAKQQLGCFAAGQEFPFGRVQWVCKTGEGSSKVWLNNKAYYYCTDQPIW